MKALVLDAGAFIAIEHNDRATVALLAKAKENSLRFVSNGGVIAEIWCGGSGGQASVARLLASIDVTPLDEEVGRAAGMLIREARGGSAIDATVVAIASEGDQIVTSDVRDIQLLIDASGRHIKVLPC